ncbi:hypothetical protein EF888_11045 [Silicimonas algicola]|nr:hypothetical protein [Silicimonas algicola]AZQ67620.1 hypothetical protein EF888_11045 [Silicimonas algicola]
MVEPEKDTKQFRMRPVGAGIYLLMSYFPKDRFPYAYSLARVRGQQIEVFYVREEDLEAYLTRLATTDPGHAKSISSQVNSVGDFYEVNSLSFVEVLLPEMLEEGFATRLNSYTVVQDHNDERSGGLDASSIAQEKGSDGTSMITEPPMAPANNGASPAGAGSALPGRASPETIKSDLGNRYDRFRNEAGDFYVSLMSPNVFVSYSASQDMMRCTIGLKLRDEEPFSIVDDGCDGSLELGVRGLKILKLSPEELYGFIGRVARSADGTRAPLPAKLATETLFGSLKYGPLGEVVGAEAAALRSFIDSRSPSATDTAQFAAMSVSRGRQLILIEVAKAEGNCYYLMNDTDAGGRNIFDEWMDLLLKIYPKEDDEWPPQTLLYIDDGCNGSIETLGFGRRFWTVGDNNYVQAKYEHSFGASFFAPLTALYTAGGILAASNP